MVIVGLFASLIPLMSDYALNPKPYTLNPKP